MMNKTIFILTFFLFISCQPEPTSKDKAWPESYSDSLTKVLRKIKKVEYENLDSLDQEITQLQAIKNDSTAQLLHNYYTKKSIFLRSPSPESAKSFLSIYEELKRKQEFKLLAEIDYFLLIYYYADLKFAQASERVRSSFDYCFKPDLELERHAFMYAVSSETILTTPQIRKEEIQKYLAQKGKDEWNLYISRINIALAKAHYYLEEYDQAIGVLDYTIKRNLEHELNLELIDCYEVKGSVLKATQPNSPDGVDYYKKAIVASEKFGTNSREIYYRMVGHYYFERENLREAANNYQKAVEFGHKLNDSTSLAVDYAYLGWALFNEDKQHNYDKANEYYEKSIQYSGLKGIPYRLGLERRIWSLELLGRKAEADKYNLQKLTAVNQALRVENDAHFQDFKINAMLGLKSRTENIELLKAQNEIQERRLLLQKYVKIFSVVIFILFLIAVYNYRKKLKINKLLQKRKEEIKQTNQQLEEKNQLITERNQSLLIKEEELVNELKAKLAMLSENERVIQDLKNSISENKSIPFPERKTLLRTLESKNSKRVIENLDFQFIELHKDFYEKMSELHPDLTANNLKMCVYLKMNLSSKEIASLMHITPGAVMVARSRLRKKLNIDESKRSLSAYLNSV